MSDERIHMLWIQACRGGICSHDPPCSKRNPYTMEVIKDE